MFASSKPLPPELTFQMLNVNNASGALLLLTHYGKYMYEELGLTAGKENFYAELEATLMNQYTKPGNLFLLLYLNDNTVGCVGIKRWDKCSCELKRMFVLPAQRNKGFGQILLNEAIRQAKALGYTEMLLDTNEEMEAAVSLYKKQGFSICDPYCENENKHVVYLKKTL